MRDADSPSERPNDGGWAISPTALIETALRYPVALSLGIGVLVGGIAGLLLRRSPVHPHVGPAAFNQLTDPKNFAQTRDAGPDNVRDVSSGSKWDKVDEAVDESFPASDPPNTY